MFDALVVIGSVVHIILSQVDVSTVPTPVHPQPYPPNATHPLTPLSLWACHCRAQALYCISPLQILCITSLTTRADTIDPGRTRKCQNVRQWFIIEAELSKLYLW